MSAAVRVQCGKKKKKRKAVMGQICEAQDEWPNLNPARLSEQIQL
jgi:hypothetical protein